VHIPEGTTIGYDTEADRERYFVTDSGITVVTRDYSLFENPGHRGLLHVKIPGPRKPMLEVIRTQFERCRHMQQIRRPGAEFGRRLSRQLACPLKDRSPLSL
jgi:hypothetical protein